MIGRLAELGAEDVALEIGPGLGVLTRYLAERVAPRPRRRARPLARAAPPGAGRASERRAPLGRRARARPRRARPGADEARREPAVQRRDADRRREPDRPAGRRALVRDGAARGRRPLLRRAVDEGLRCRLGARPARRPPHRLPPGRAHGLPAAAERRLRARRLPARAAARALRARQGGRRGLVRAPAQDAAQLALALPGSPTREQCGRRARGDRRGPPRPGPRRSSPPSSSRSTEAL